MLTNIVHVHTMLSSFFYIFNIKKHGELETWKEECCQLWKKGKRPKEDMENKCPFMYELKSYRSDVSAWPRSGNDWSGEAGSHIDRTHKLLLNMLSHSNPTRGE